MRSVLVVVLAVPAVLVWLIFAALQNEGVVTEAWRADAGDIARARSVLAEHDPRNFPAGVERRVVISQRDLNLAANYAFNALGIGAARVELRDEALDFDATVELAANPIGRYLNLRATMRPSTVPDSGLPSLARLAIGDLKVPQPIANWVFDKALRHLYTLGVPGDHPGVDPSDLISAVVIRSGSMVVSYRLPEGTLARLQSALLSVEDRARMEIYQHALVAQVARTPRSGAPLLGLLQPMFALARERSRKGTPEAENRALLAILGAYSGGRGLQVLAPEAAGWPSPPPRELLLHGRGDFSQHFLTSAGLAALAGSTVADAVGLFKEVDDSRGGSGFSFTDLAADRAGTRFGAKAVRSRADALRVQDVLARTRADLELMPNVDDLPEGLSAREFKQRFESTKSVAYRKVTEAVERRLDALALYR